MNQLFLGNEPRKELINPIRNGYLPNKAFGGIWTSTLENNTSSWVETGIPQSKEGWILSVREDVNVLQINEYTDLEKVFEEYGYRNEDFGFGIYTPSFIDFEKISQNYDGVRLTEEGQYRTRLSYPYNLYGWDCESTHWFRWVFESVESLGRIKVR